MTELSSRGDDDDEADDDEADDDEADEADKGLDEATSSSVLAFKASSSL